MSRCLVVALIYHPAGNKRSYLALVDLQFPANTIMLTQCWANPSFSTFLRQLPSFAIIQKKIQSTCRRLVRVADRILYFYAFGDYLSLQVAAAQLHIADRCLDEKMFSGIYP